MEIRTTEHFEQWFAALMDRTTRARLVFAIEKLKLGNFGNTKHLTAGLFEIRANFGPGYRIYYCRQGETIIILLVGGDKSSQRRDIDKALELMERI
ncbi:MAG TPA: type II toxin-antitoxin system RelE/ParE family toxin [Anaerolineaceae bacterium]|nr:type II toxin-antitoxin system RelE/ParE family toxin [Anaerolineaceae bacterium]